MGELKNHIYRDYKNRVICLTQRAGLARGQAVPALCTAKWLLRQSLLTNTVSVSKCCITKKIRISPK